MYTSHEYSGLLDLDSMLSLVSTSWKHDWPRNRFHVGDVWWFVGLGREETPDIPHPSIRLWTGDDGTVVGFAWLDGPDSGDVLVHADHRRRGIEEEMLVWLEETHRLQAAPEGGASTLETGSYENPHWQALLEARGFRHDDSVKGVPLFWRSLDALEPSAPPEGFVVREVAGEHEATARTMVQREAFANLDFDMPGRPASRRAPAAETAEIERRTRIYRNIMRLPGYRRELDIVVEAANGDFAVCCTCWLDSENRVGEFEPVGCHPDFRQRGLTRAAMLEGMRRLRSLGAEAAVVSTHPLNVPAMGLYQSCGFEAVFYDPLYRKTFAG